MTSKYEDLLSIASSQRASRHDFEDRALKKTVELFNELAAFLAAPKEKIMALKFEPRDDEAAAPLGTVITSSGLKFGIRVFVDLVFVNFISIISPAGDRPSLASVEGHLTIIPCLLNEKVEHFG